MQNGNKLIAGLLVAAALFFIVWNNFSKTDPNKVIALVNDEEITHQNLLEAKKQFVQKPNSPAEDELLTKLINNKVAKIYAQQNGYYEDTEMIEEFEWQQNEAKKTLLINYLLKEKGKENVDLTDQDYSDFLDLHPYVQVMTIFIPIQGDDSTKAYKTASKAYEKLEAGKDFEKVREKFMDKRFLEDLEGTELVKEQILANLNAETLEVGNYTKPIYTSNGYYIIKKFDDPDFATLKKQVHDELRSEKEQSYYGRYIDSLKRSITLNENNLKLLLEPDRNIDNNTVIATFDDYDKVLTYSDIKKYFEYFLTPEQIQNIVLSDLKNITNEIALQELLYDIANKEDLENNEDFQKLWEKEQQEISKSWDAFVIDKVYMNVFTEGLDVSEEEIQAYYDTHQDEYKDQPYNTAKHKIKYEMQEQKMDDWFDNIIEKYDIVVEKK